GRGSADRRAGAEGRGGARRRRAGRPYEPGHRRGRKDSERAPLEPTLAVDELRLEEIDGDAELEEPPVVGTRLQPARGALDLPEGIGRDAGRDPDAAGR